MSPDLYRSIASVLPHGAVFVVGHDLRYQLAAGAELVAGGYSPADFIGRTVQEAVPEHMVEAYTRDFNIVLKGGVFDREHQVGKRFYHSYGVPLRKANDPPYAALVVSYDITERADAEYRLRLLSALSDISWSCSSCDAVITKVSSVLQERLGNVELFAAEFVRDTGKFSEISHIWIRTGQPAIQERNVFGMDVVKRLEAGQVLTGSSEVDSVAVRQFNAEYVILLPKLLEGRLVGVLGIVGKKDSKSMDEAASTIQVVAECVWEAISRCKHLEILTEANRHKNQLIAVLSHELRSPAATLNLALDMFKTRAAEIGAGDAINLMARQIGQISRVVEDLLSLSYLTQGTLELQLEKLNLKDLVGNVIEAQQVFAMRKRQKISYKGTAQPIWISADASKLVQIMTNVISNSIKYNSYNGTIFVELNTESSEVSIIVSDSGDGMTQNTLKSLFKPFVRGGVDHPAEGRVAGLGIGLWVAAQLVQSHGGSIKAWSEGIGKGSRFEIRLPNPLAKFKDSSA